VSSSSAPDAVPSRDALLGLLARYVVESNRLGRAFAERHGLHYTDWQALLAVHRARRAGVPLTPGDLGEHLVLSSGATTAVLDRLQRGEYLQRVRDARDRRRLTLHLVPRADDLLSGFYADVDAAAEVLVSGYDDEQRAVVARFLADAAGQLALFRRRLADR
jgi:DNA-binding MarR family transcriptional regulator